MIFHFFFTHVGRSLLEGLQRGSWLSLDFHYIYLHVDWGKQSAAGAGAETGTSKCSMLYLHSGKF